MPGSLKFSRNFYTRARTQSRSLFSPAHVVNIVIWMSDVTILPTNQKLPNGSCDRIKRLRRALWKGAFDVVVATIYRCFLVQFELRPQVILRVFQLSDVLKFHWGLVVGTIIYSMQPGHADITPANFSKALFRQIALNTGITLTV